jgi:CHAT domain-containing protein/Tfp pilus assembly protein PilF
MQFAKLRALPSWALLVLALSALAAGVSAQTTRLELGKTIAGDLPGGQTRSYSIKLKANQYLRAVVTQPVAAVVIELYAQDGKKVLEVDTRNYRSKPSRIVWVAGSSGEHRIDVAGEGHYEIKLLELRNARPNDRKQVEAERLFTQGLSEAHKNSYDLAIATLTRALGLYREVKDREREGDTLHAEGNEYWYLSQNEKAMGYYDQALTIYRELKDRRGEGNSMVGRGMVYDQLSQYEKGVSSFEQALTIYREIKDRRGRGNTLNNLGLTYLYLSQYEKAIGYLEQAREIEGDLKDRPSESNSLNNIGLAYRKLSDYGRAIGYHEQALIIYREINDLGGEARAFNNLGVAYAQLSQNDKAIGYYEQALTIYRELHARLGEGYALTDIGLAYDDLGQYEKAIGYYEQALAIAQEIKDRQNEGVIFGNLGTAYHHLGQYAKAVGYHSEGLAIAREVKDRDNEARTLFNLGGTHAKLEQNEKAIGYYEQALVLSREVKDRHEEEKQLSALMDIWQASGRPRIAVFYGKQAVNVIQGIRGDIGHLGQDSRQSFLEVNRETYLNLAGILISQGRLTEAEQVLALLKEEEFFQYIRRDAGEASSLNRRADLTPEEAEYDKRYREISDQLMTLGVERGELLGKKTLTPEQSQRLVQVEQDLTAGNHVFERFLRDLTQHFSAKAESTVRIDTLRETQGIMEDLRELPDGTVAIFTLVGEDHLYTILRTPDAEKAYEYPIKAAELNAKIAAFRLAIQDPTLDARPLAQELYKVLIGAMAEDLRQAKATTLMWSLDGALRYIPLAALYDGRQYLIEHYRVSVMTLASNTRLKDQPDRKWKAAGFGVTKGFEDAPALPSVSSELNGIISSNPGDGGVLAGEIKLDDQFTQQSMRQTLLRHYPVVHIASHFRFAAGNDTKSFLLLGDGAHLTLAELKGSVNLFGGVQLLTLSACNTGVGDGAEVEGFGTLAQRQGAKAVIASLWPVADESTSRLMQEFYRIRESSAGITKLEALREAQLALLRGEVQIKPAAKGDRGVVANRPTSGAAHPEAPSFPLNASAPYAHPFYWAPFFLMGNWL